MEEIVRIIVNTTIIIGFVVFVIILIKDKSDEEV
jgi:hypothetical protein